CKIALRYERVEIPPGSFATALAEFAAAGGSGMSVTVPLKEEAYRAAAEHALRAFVTGAANMLTIADDGTTIADNADGTGLVRDLLSNRRLLLAGRRILLLGAGGAARGVIPSLLEQQPGELTIVNRTLSKAEGLVERFRQLGLVRAFDYERLPRGPYDLIINATSLSLSGEIPPLDPRVISGASFCYDMMYTADGRTRFLDWCGDHGAAACSDGLGMLVEQAASAFSIWHGVQPDTAPVIASLRE
ncbi:MAG TPA: shikimate dehydrogenase, partial [Gammaproteobacteria bacterium]|nr:shikimate dehydrogenase [Gammaproteobacteria bacterium]